MDLPEEDILALLIVSSFLILLLLVLLFFYSPRLRQCLFGSSSSLAGSSLPSSSPSARDSVPKQVDVEEPLLSNNFGEVPSQISHSARRCPSEEYRHEDEVKVSSLLTHLSSKKIEKQLIGRLTPDEVVVGQTLRFTDIPNWKEEDLAHERELNARNDSELLSDSLRHKVSKVVEESVQEQSTLILEVISGPSRGLQCVRKSTNCYTPLTLGRISSSDMFLEDSGVSGKHAVVNWNKNTFKWELVDIGSLNGTLLNSRAVHNPDLGRPSCSAAVELSDGDIITLGSSSKLFVQIKPCVENFVPFRVGIASDPMALRRGGKSLPMEDALYCQWPLPGVNKFGLFGIFDGHGGALAANTACKILPQILSHCLSNSEERDKVLSSRDASEVLKEAFSQTEAALSYQYEGCTATVLLLWADHRKELFAQCANVGDSACVVNIDGIDIKMTEDHRISSASERTRFCERGQPLEAGQTRLYGINIGRMLGDKFIKEQDSRFSSEPYISQAVHLKRLSKAFAILASDGLWDVISIKRAVQLVLQAKATVDTDQGNLAENIAKDILNEAKALRTKDNTSVIFLDFDIL